jgi:hypothetical protein
MLTFGQPAVVAGTHQTLSNLFWRLLISIKKAQSCFNNVGQFLFEVQVRGGGRPKKNLHLVMPQLYETKIK